MFLQWRYGYSQQNDSRDYGGEKTNKSSIATKFDEKINYRGERTTEISCGVCALLIKFLGWWFGGG